MSGLRNSKRTIRFLILAFIALQVSYQTSKTTRPATQRHAHGSVILRAADHPTVFFIISVAALISALSLIGLAVREQLRGREAKENELVLRDYRRRPVFVVAKIAMMLVALYGGF